MRLNKHQSVVLLSVIAGLLCYFISSPTIKVQAQSLEESSDYIEMEWSSDELPATGSDDLQLPPPPDPPENIDESHESRVESSQELSESNVEQPTESSSTDETSSNGSEQSSTSHDVSSSGLSSSSSKTLDETPDETVYTAPPVRYQPPSKRVESGQVDVGTFSRRQLASLVLRIAETQTEALTIISKILVLADYVPVYLSSQLIPLSQLYGQIILGNIFK